MDQYKVDVPEGTSGSWAIQKFEVSRHDAVLFSLSSSGRGRYVLPGRYTRLMRGRTVVMSDTDAEIRDHLSFIWKACKVGGRILIHGLGLGMCANAVLQSPNVEHVLIIEQSPDVIALVAPHYQAKFGARLEIRQDDAYTWKPAKGERWSCAWHDIFDDLSVENLELMTKLHRRFGRYVDWQDSWGKSFLRRLQQQEKEAERRESRRFRW